MGFKCGIVGLPNVGKSTLFNALTQTSAAQAANYPFCTIEPNVGDVGVPDPRLDDLAKIAGSAQIIPTRLTFVDIAGLVKGASKGEGLGNQFLANIRETDAIAHVVRCFQDDNVIHVAGKVSPTDDIEVIHTELALADLQSVDKAILRVGKNTRSGDKEAIKLAALLEKVKNRLDQGTPVRAMGFDLDEMKLLKPMFFLTAKPAIYVANVKEHGFDNNPLLDRVVAYAKTENAPVIAICAALEAEISDLSEEDKKLFLADAGMEEPGLNRLIRGAYSLLGLETYFTAGEKEVRAWTIPIGATAPQAAGAIHTDFEKGFIRAEVIAFHDYVALKGEQGAKEVGKMRLEGKEYVVKDGDVMHFRFNV